MLFFLHDEHQVNEPQEDEEPSRQWGINLYYQDRADFYLTKNDGKPVLSLEELVLEFIDVPDKPDFPTSDQMRSRSQQLGYGRTAVPNFQTNSDVNVWVQDRLLPATVEEWRLLGEQTVFVLAHGHHPVKGQVIILSTKALIEKNLRQEVNTSLNTSYLLYFATS